MKVFIILIVVTGLFYGCTNHQEPDSNLAGTYVTHFKNEYYITDDTLVVQVYSKENELYDVASHTGYRPIKDGVLQPKKYKTQNRKLKWDSEKQVLTEGELGRQIHFIAKKYVLLSGGSEYHKIN